MPKLKPGAALAALRPRVKHVCPPPCGKKFKAVGTAIYCSNACRQRAKNDRIRDAKEQAEADASP